MIDIHLLINPALNPDTEMIIYPLGQGKILILKWSAAMRVLKSPDD
jgi:hypothetical protein